jgi:hypothetical protein
VQVQDPGGRGERNGSTLVLRELHEMTALMLVLFLFLILLL